MEKKGASFLSKVTTGSQHYHAGILTTEQGDCPTRKGQCRLEEAPCPHHPPDTLPLEGGRLTNVTDDWIVY